MSTIDKICGRNYRLCLNHAKFIDYKIFHLS